MRQFYTQRSNTFEYQGNVELSPLMVTLDSGQVERATLSVLIQQWSLNERIKWRNWVTMSTPSAAWLAINRWFHRDVVDPTVQESSSTFVDAIDVPSDPATNQPGNELIGYANVPTRTRISAAAQYGQECRLELNCTRRTAAMELAVRAWLNREFDNNFVRRIDRRVLLPLAIEAAFVPSRYEIEAHHMANTVEVVTRQLQLEANVYSNENRRWFHLWPRKLRRRPTVSA
jgi:hypothetical protein